MVLSDHGFAPHNGSIFKISARDCRANVGSAHSPTRSPGEDWCLCSSSCWVFEGSASCILVSFLAFLRRPVMELGFPRCQPFMDPFPPEFSIFSEGLPFFDGEVEGTEVTFTGVFKPQKGSPNRSLAIFKLAVQHVPWQSSVLHSVNMPESPHSSLPQECVDGRKVCTCKNSLVCGHVVPFYSQDTAQASDTECVELFLYGRVHSPCFTAVHQGAQDTSLIHSHFRFHCELGIFPDSCSKHPKVVAALPILWSISLSRESSSVIVNPSEPAKSSQARESLFRMCSNCGFICKHSAMT